MEGIFPVHANSFFIVSRDGAFNQILTYDYYDPSGYYSLLTHRPLDFKKEINKLWSNMQDFLDEETIKVNDVVVRPLVKHVDIEHRGSETTPFLTWIIYFEGRFSKGNNIFETWTEEERATYDFEVYWYFPPKTAIIEIDSPMDYDPQDNILILWARKGDEVGGYEKIVFKLAGGVVKED